MGDPAREAVKRALLICGGARSLCARLGINPATLQSWLDGAEMPRAQLVRVIEIVVADYDAWRAQDRRSEPRALLRAGRGAPAGIT